LAVVGSNSLGNSWAQSGWSFVAPTRLAAERGTAVVLLFSLLAARGVCCLGERANQVAENRRLAEDRHRAQMRPPPRSCRPASDLSRLVKIPVLRCTASRDIKATPTPSLSC